MEKIPDDRIAQVVQNYAARDVKVTQAGQFVAEFHFYLDTEPKLDFVYELGTVLLVSPMPPEFMDVISVQDTPSGLKSAHSTRKSQEPARVRRDFTEDRLPPRPPGRRHRLSAKLLANASSLRPPIT